MAQAQSVAAPKRLPLVVKPDNRGWTSAPGGDARIINGYVELTDQDENEYWVYKRPGLALQSTVAASTAGHGIYNWLGDIYSVFGGTLYKNGVSQGSVDSSAIYRWKETLGASPKLVFNNGGPTTGYYYSGGVITTIASNYPSPAVKGIAYLDSTLYVSDTKNNTVGSNLNDPSIWGASANTIAAQIESDNNITIDKQLVYVVVLKQWSTEFFYDAGNATGSPLGPVQGAKVNFGCIHADTLQAIDSILFYLCRGRDGPAQIMQIENAKPTIISTKPIERLFFLSQPSHTYYSWQCKFGGHKFYVLTNKTLNLTMAYDITDRRWHQWTDANGNYMPIVASTSDSNNNVLVQHESNGNIYFISPNNFTDAGSVIITDIYTPNYDGNTRRRKQLNSLEFIGDKQPGSYLLVRNNDFDYAAGRWTNFRRVDMWKDRSFLTDCGSFQRRAYHIRHAAPTQLRLQAVEMQIDIGTL